MSAGHVEDSLPSRRAPRPVVENGTHPIEGPPSKNNTSYIPFFLSPVEIGTKGNTVHTKPQCSGAGMCIGVCRGNSKFERSERASMLSKIRNLDTHDDVCGGRESNRLPIRKRSKIRSTVPVQRNSVAEPPFWSVFHRQSKGPFRHIADHAEGTLRSSHRSCIGGLFYDDNEEITSSTPNEKQSTLVLARRRI